MCVYYGSINKTINAKKKTKQKSLTHSRYLSNAGNIIQSWVIFSLFYLEYTFVFNMGTYNNAHINIKS